MSRSPSRKPAPGPIDLEPASINPFRYLLEPAEWTSFKQTMEQASETLRNRRIWNINSTAHGGGVAEMLDWQIPYERGVGMDTRWLVIEADSEFFTFTKRLHNLLHGESQNGSSITAAERECFERTTETNLRAIAGELRAGDVAIVHDPQPAGLIPYLVQAGLRVIWRCHIGVDQPNDTVRAAWRFLLPAIKPAHASVFSRRTYAWEGLDASSVTIIPPAIDAFTPKNQDLTGDAVIGILQATGILGGHAGSDPAFHTRGGFRRHVSRHTRLTPASPVPADASLVVQVSRWDRLKDPLGVMQGFGQRVAPSTDAYLILAGPGASTVADDPEEAEVLNEVQECWRSLPPAVGRRIRIARLPMDDSDENAAIVNAMQRRAKIVVQKSLAEGFGLTVSEAMWKARPVVASRVGGIIDQIEDGESGLLVEPYDLDAFGSAVSRLLQDPVAAARLGAGARDRVRREFLAPRLLMQHARLMTSLIENAQP